MIGRQHQASQPAPGPTLSNEAPPISRHTQSFLFSFCPHPRSYICKSKTHSNSSRQAMATKQDTRFRVILVKSGCSACETSLPCFWQRVGTGSGFLFLGTKKVEREFRCLVGFHDVNVFRKISGLGRYLCTCTCTYIHSGGGWAERKLSVYRGMNNRFSKDFP